MKTNLHLAIALLLFSAIAHSQVGVNTTNPQGAFHIDGASDNNASGLPAITQASNDVIVTPAGSLGVGTATPDNSSILDLDVNSLATGNKKGFLAPRVALTGLADNATISSPANALTVFNTATAGVAPDNVVPGYYYWSAAASKWVKIGGDSAPEPWQVQGSNTPATANTQNIYQMGFVSIGATTVPSFLVGATTVQSSFHVEGDISTAGKIYTTNSVYADYVFEKYFEGTSVINPDYEFKSLRYVKDFIKTNHHLPGVASIDALKKSVNGYTFDMTKLSIQSLEKLEELYIHTIEQQDKIEQQQSEIEKLKQDLANTTKRFEKLERLLLEK